MRAKLFIFVVLLSAAAVPVSLFAQVAEVNPYAGFYWPGSPALTPNSVGDFQNNQLLGIRGGYYVTSGFEIGGNYGWSNHFQPKSTDVASSFAGAAGFTQGIVRANIWEAEFSYNFAKRSVSGYSVKPYVVAGAGGLTTRVENECSIGTHAGRQPARTGHDVRFYGITRHAALREIVREFGFPDIGTNDTLRETCCSRET